MARERNPNREKAKGMYLKAKGNIKLIDIANELKVLDTQIRKWKSTDRWDKELIGTDKERSKGNAPIGDNKDVSWVDIENEYVTDIRKKACTLEEISKKYAIPIQTVKDQSNKNSWVSKKADFKQKTIQKATEKATNIVSTDIARYKTKHLDISDIVLNEIKKSLSNEKELYTIVEKIKTGYGKGEFDEKIVTEELNVINDAKVLNLVNALDKLQKMQRQTLGVMDAKDIKEKDVPIIDSDKPFELPARLIAPSFAPTVFDIEDKLHKEYVLYGGRGSTKSSFVGLEIINLIKKNPTMHALACRKVENTLRDSVYNQLKWAISALELNNEFNCKLSPLEIEYKATGQRIYFRGCDDETKIKSIKPPFGYIGILWMEELDQYNGAEQIRNIEQSAIRGGDDAYIFKTFNPPKTANNWANKYIKIPKENQYQLHNDYLNVPYKWLGKTFIEEALHLKSVNPTAYEHEYLGIANGNGGNVFDNVEIRTITDEEISGFDRLYYGVDWGFYPDKYAFTKMYYNHNQHTLYILEEYCVNRKTNKETYEELIRRGIKPNDKIVADSSEPKSIEDYRSYGLFCRGAIKGPGSVNYKMKWLQSLSKVVIDNTRTPETAKEFLDYEYDRDKEGNPISGYPDKNNHCIDSISYALEEVWKRKGM